MSGRVTTVMLLWLTLSGSQISKANIEPFPTTAPDSYELVGEARLKVLWFEVYDARLSSSSGSFNTNEPLLLSLTYLRNISKQRLISETKQQLQGRLDNDRLSSALTELESIWSDVEKGDCLSFWLTADNRGGFYLNHRFIGAVEDPEFNRAFINIWVAETSSFPKLAKQLRGMEG